MNRHLLAKNLDVFPQNVTFFLQILIKARGKYKQVIKFE